MQKQAVSFQKKSVMSIGLLAIFGFASINAMETNFADEEKNQQSFDYSVIQEKATQYKNGFGNYIGSWFATDHVNGVQKEVPVIEVAKVEEEIKVVQVQAPEQTQGASASWMPTISMPNISIESLMKNQKVLAVFGIVGVAVIGGSVYILYKKGVFDKAIAFVKNNKCASAAIGTVIAGAIAVATKVAMNASAAKTVVPAPAN